MTTCPASFAEDPLRARVRANLASLRGRIEACGRSLESVRIVGVTKTFDESVVRAAAAEGITTLGENYVNEMAAKVRATADLGLRWHYLGALQTNKIARILEVADLVAGVSRLREIERIAALAPGTALYVEVDFSGDPGRGGASAHDVPGLVAAARARGLDVRGLMTVAPRAPGAARAAFAATNALCEDLGLPERSMGMTDDLELALEQGSSEVRVGRGLFGQRARAQALA